MLLLSVVLPIIIIIIGCYYWFKQPTRRYIVPWKVPQAPTVGRRVRWDETKRYGTVDKTESDDVTVTAVYVKFDDNPGLPPQRFVASQFQAQFTAI